MCICFVCVSHTADVREYEGTVRGVKYNDTLGHFTNHILKVKVELLVSSQSSS